MKKNELHELKRITQIGKMKNDYIEIDEKKYRVQFDWTAITSFLEAEGLRLGDVDNLNDLKPSQVTGLIYSGIIEGCILDGKEFPFSKAQFSSMIVPYHVGELMIIYQRQTMVKKKGTTDDGEIPKPVRDDGHPKQKKSLMSRLRSKGSSS